MGKRTYDVRVDLHDIIDVEQILEYLRRDAPANPQDHHVLVVYLNT